MAHSVDLSVGASDEEVGGSVQYREAVQAMRVQVAEMLASISQERESVANEQRAQLAEYYGSLSDAVSVLMDGFAEKRADLASSQTAALKAYRAELAGSVKDAMEQVASLYAGQYPASIRAYHAELVASIRKARTDFRATRHQEVVDQLKSLTAFHEDLVDSVKKSLEGFRVSHQKMASDQSEQLMQFCGELVSETELLRKEVAAMLEAIKDEHGERRDAVNRMAEETQEMLRLYRGESSAAIDFEDDVDCAKESPAEPTLDEDDDPVSVLQEERGSSDSAESDNTNPELYPAERDGHDEIAGIMSAPESSSVDSDDIMEADLETQAELKEKSQADLQLRILELLQNHPEGLRVSDMEEPLDDHRSRIGVAAKKLLNTKQVSKEGGRYFPIKGMFE